MKCSHINENRTAYAGTTKNTRSFRKGLSLDEGRQVAQHYLG